MLLGERAGGEWVFASGEVESERPLRDCRSSPSDFLVWFLAGVASGDDAIIRVDEGLLGEARSLQPSPVHGGRVLGSGGQNRYYLCLWGVKIAVATFVMRRCSCDRERGSFSVECRKVNHDGG